MKLCLMRVQEAESPHERGVTEQLWSCVVWQPSGQKGSILGFAINSKGSATLGKAQHLPLSLSPSAPLWLHGSPGQCGNLLLPLTWGRRSSHLHALNHHPAKSCAVFHTEFAGWINAPETTLVSAGQPRAWLNVGAVLA